MLNIMNKIETNNKLEEFVLEECKARTVDYDKPQGFFEDLRHGGCASGMIGGMTYYKDTLEFYDKFKENINEMIKSSQEETGFTSFKEMFGDKFDSEDPLCLETNNQNLLAWYAFEEVAFRFGDEIEALEDEDSSLSDTSLADDSQSNEESNVHRQ